MSNRYIDNEKYFAFNVWSVESAIAVIAACQKAGRNALLQTSTKAFATIPQGEFCAFVKNYAKKAGIGAYIHLDHSKKESDIILAINSGWDSVMIDASDLELQENIRITNHICEIAHRKNVLVEAEVGHINGLDGVARYEDVVKFIDETNVDMLAVAAGTKHGFYNGKPQLDFALLERVNNYCDMPLVIHGGTGLSDEQFETLLSVSNVRKINISTDVKQSYREGLMKADVDGLLEKSGFDPIKVDKSVCSEIERMVISKLKLLEKV